MTIPFLRKLAALAGAACIAFGAAAPAAHAAGNDYL